MIIAGSLWMAVQYTAIGGSSGQKREVRSRISSSAREALNAKLSWQKLMLVLAANFSPGDVVATLTYRDDGYPRNREEADKRLDYFIRQFRAVRRAQGKQLVYARVTEGYHSHGRLHHHLIFNSTGEDLETVKRLWQRNGDNVDFEEFGRDGPERWAKYLTKEPREQGRRHVGDRTWRTSRNVKKPVVKSIYVTEDAALSPPPGAFILDRTECENCYGKFLHIMARLPEKAAPEKRENRPWGSVY